MRRLAFAVIAVGACLASSAQADPVPVFGPLTFERTEGAPDVHVESFSGATGGSFALLVRNGDAEGNRVSEATIEINGVGVVSPGSIDADLSALRLPVTLAPGTNELRVTLDGASGSFLTIAIVDPAHPTTFVFGRLVLPWGRDDEGRELGLAFKNGATGEARALRALFVRPDGSIAAVSARFFLPPRGSIALPVSALLPPGSSWSAGSIEVYWAGPGLARVHGQARELSTAPGALEIVALEPAGIRVVRTPAGPLDGSRPARPIARDPA